MDKLKQIIKGLSNSYIEEIIGIRRHIHAHPELSMQEHKTAEFIAATLAGMGLEVKTGVAKTGIIALVKGKNPDKKTIALRADMDALEIKEENNVP